MKSELNQPPPASDIVWACVEDGFYVASCSNRFLGFVDRIDTEAFQVCDGRSQQVGMFGSLEAAQDCLVRYSLSAEPTVTEMGGE